jgi:MOSC domain-containing protein YiiM
MTEAAVVRLRLGRGIEGDRYAALEGARGQVTFFAEETWLRLCCELSVERDPGVFRRNILVRGADLNSLIGAEFEVQGMRFGGVEHCKPCYWMDQAFAPGTLGRLGEWKAGGLRAAVLSDGVLSAEPVLASRCSA